MELLIQLKTRARRCTARINVRHPVPLSREHELKSRQTGAELHDPQWATQCADFMVGPRIFVRPGTVVGLIAEGASIPHCHEILSPQAAPESVATTRGCVPPSVPLGKVTRQLARSKHRRLTVGSQGLTRPIPVSSTGCFGSGNQNWKPLLRCCVRGQSCCASRELPRNTALRPFDCCKRSSTSTRSCFRRSVSMRPCRG